MESARTVLTFISGLVLGGVAIYLSPPVTDPGAAPCAPGGAPAPVELPRPGLETALTPDRIPQAIALTPPPDVPAPEVLSGPPIIADGAAAQVLGTAPQAPLGTVGLDEHLATARIRWLALADRSEDSFLDPLVSDMRTVAALVPERVDRPPPLQEVVVLLVEEVRLLDRIRMAGGDAGDLATEVAALLRHERGRVPGGAQTRYEQRSQEKPVVP